MTHAHTIHMHSCTHFCVQQSSSSTRAHMHPSARCHSLPHTRIPQTHNLQPLFVCTNIFAHSHHTHPAKTSKRGAVRKHPVNCTLKKTHSRTFCDWDISSLSNSSSLLLSSKRTGLLLLPSLSKSSEASTSFFRICASEGMLISKQPGNPVLPPWSLLPCGERGPFRLQNQAAWSDSNPAGWRTVGKGQGRGKVAPWGSLGLGPFWQCP